MANLEDFGKKIGGARKDVWKARGLIKSDLSEMNDMERRTHIKKDNIWLRPDWEQLIKDGTPQSVAFWQNSLRQAIPPRPYSDTEIEQEEYVSVVTHVRDLVMAVREPDAINTFYRDVLRPALIELGCYNNYYKKLLRAANTSRRSMERKAEEKLFGIPKDERVYTSTKNNLAVYQFDRENVYFKDEAETGEDLSVLIIKSQFGRSFYYLRSESEYADKEKWTKDTFFVMDKRHGKPVSINLSSREEAETLIETISREAQKIADKSTSNQEKTSGRKGAFTPPQLSNIKRDGPNYRSIRHATGDMFLGELKFRGGEYGNWLNENDRQTNLDMAYDAFRDLARLLQIRPEDVSLNGSLAIAFGARGRGGAGAGAAHYEPNLRVINLTKMSGAGCLAHEWGHALDHAIGISLGSTDLATEMRSFRTAPESARPVMQALSDLKAAMRYKWKVVQPEDLRESLEQEIARGINGLDGWISSVKPRNLPAEAERAWNDARERIIASAEEYTGCEYGSFGQPKPDVEIMSQIRKKYTNHVIPKDAKVQFCLWAREIGKAQRKLRTCEPKEQRVETDFFKGSGEFDSVYSKAGHGYWQSECEMFARAFDCYISDKIKAAGQKSDYLSSHADSFAMPGKNGETIYAVPKGEEREKLNACFDKLLAAVKEQELLHDFIEEPIQEAPQPQRKSRPISFEPLPTKETHYEQMSFEALLFDAEQRAQSGASCASKKPQDLTR